MIAYRDMWCFQQAHSHRRLGNSLPFPGLLLRGCKCGWELRRRREKKKKEKKEAFEFPQKKPKNMLAFSMNIGGAVEFLCNAINVTAPPVVKSNNKDEHLPRCSRFFHLSWLRFCTAATRLQLPASFQKTLQHTAATGGKQMWKSPQLKDDYRCFNMIT